jgi:hypothetical protein
MASCSARCFLSDEELLVAVNTVESEDEYLKICDFDSEFHPGDNEDGGSVVIDHATPQTSRKRNRPNPPVFQWHSGAFNPVIHVFDDSASGISTNEIQDEPTALDIFVFFFSRNYAGNSIRNQQVLPVCDRQNSTICRFKATKMEKYDSRRIMFFSPLQCLWLG